MACVWFDWNCFLTKLHAPIIENSRYVPLLWALPSPQTISTVGTAQELSHSVSHYKSRRLSFQVSESKQRCKSHESSKWRFSYSCKDHIDSPIVVHDPMLNRERCLLSRMNRLRRRLIWSPIANCEDCGVEVEYWSRYAKIIIIQNEDAPTSLLIT